jgi:hypothetical protein
MSWLSSGRTRVLAAKRDGGVAPCYTCLVPTTRPRHTITETPPVQEALDELRAQMREGDARPREERIDFAELLILGAQAKVQRLRRDGAAAREAREHLAEMIRSGSGHEPDIAAAEEVKHLGLIANYE